jgi:multiple sugar transport system permease protein
MSWKFVHVQPTPPLSVRRAGAGFSGGRAGVAAAASGHPQFQNVGVIGTAGSWVGFENYAAVLGGSSFWAALWRSVVWVAANAVVQTALALAVALILNQQFPGVRIARTWVILAWIVPTVVVVIIWRWLLSSSGGMINPLLMQAGIIERPVGFFATREGAMASLVMVNSWRWFPFTALMMLAGPTRIHPIFTRRLALTEPAP